MYQAIEGPRVEWSPSPDVMQSYIDTLVWSLAGADPTLLQAVRVGQPLPLRLSPVDLCVQKLLCSRVHNSRITLRLWCMARGGTSFLPPCAAVHSGGCGFLWRACFFRQRLDEAHKRPDFALYLVFIMTRGSDIGAPMEIRQVSRSCVCVCVCVFTCVQAKLLGTTTWQVPPKSACT